MKETYKRNLQKRPVNESQRETDKKTLLKGPAEEAHERDLQKKSAKEICKRDL